MILPAIFVLALVVGWPLARAVELSFDTLNLRRPAQNGTTGIHNYVRLVGDAHAWRAVGLSALFMASTVASTVALALSAALLTRKVSRCRALVRLALLMPWTVPAVVTALIWGVMYDPDFGIVNRTFHALGFGRGPNWLIDRQTAFWALVVAQVWNEFPMAYVFILAGLMAIPTELYEAAQIDRASAWAQFRFVTLPLLRPVLAVTVAIAMIMGFKAFPVIYVLTGGGPNRATETLTVLTFTTAFRDLDFAYAATLGVVGLAVTAVLVAGYLRLLGRTRGDR
jgi:multiple sugar transport system permease protein